MSKVGKEKRRDVSLVAERKIRWQDKRHRDANPVAERKIQWQKKRRRDVKERSAERY